MRKRRRRSSGSTTRTVEFDSEWQGKYITIQADVESSWCDTIYGADADGNRGMPMTEFDHEEDNVSVCFEYEDGRRVKYDGLSLELRNHVDLEIERYIKDVLSQEPWEEDDGPDYDPYESRY